MAQHQVLSGEARTVIGKKVSTLRREGLVPGIVYGPVVDEPVPVSVEAKAFSQIYQAIGSTSLIDLTVDGQTHTVFVREVQSHPVRRQLLHIDFYAPNLRVPIVASVPVVTVGELGATVEGVLALGRHEIEVRALPDNIPHSIEIDISGLEKIDDSIFVSGATAPEGVEILTPDDELLAKVAPPEPEEEEEEPEEVLIEGEAEAEAAEAEVEETAEEEE